MTIDDIVQKIQSVPVQGGRRLVALAGAPASGKSTLAKALAGRILNACVVPMDGFHRENADLDRHGLLARKGAPETFSAQAFVAFVRSLRTAEDLRFPTFDRANDCVVPKGGLLPATVETILVEGNYLLLNRDPWTQLIGEWDLSLMIDVPLPVLETRLVARWIDNGHDSVAALARARQNDLPNAQTVATQSVAADVMI